MTDVIVAGLGAMGSSALYHLSRRGAQVLGIEQFQSPHNMGSSHGDSRIIREAYWEHPLYVPMVRRSYQLWEELAAAAGEPLYQKTGGLMLGRREGPLIAGSLASAVQHQVEHQILSADQIRRRWPGFAPPDDFVGLYEDRAGALFPERSIAAHLRLAKEMGAEVQGDLKVTGWAVSGGRVHVSTTRGAFHARQLVLAMGAWLPGFLPVTRVPLQVERQTFHWFAPKDPAIPMDAVQTPIGLVEPTAGRQFWMVPDLGKGIKAGIHHEGPAVDPDTTERTTTREEESGLRGLLEQYLPGANGALRATSVCLYTNTPDRHFVVDRLPDNPAILVLSPCSGHGFKFACVIGEIAADLVLTGTSRFDLAPFSLDRFRS